MKIATLLLICGMVASEVDAGWVHQDSGGAKGSYVPVTVYDPARNADQDLRDALTEASRSGKRVLLDVGGEWCSWCHIFDAFFEHNARLLELRNKNFIMLKINVSNQPHSQYSGLRFDIRRGQTLRIDRQRCRLDRRRS